MSAMIARTALRFSFSASAATDSESGMPARSRASSSWLKSMSGKRERPRTTPNARTDSTDRPRAAASARSSASLVASSSVSVTAASAPIALTR